MGLKEKTKYEDLMNFQIMRSTICRFQDRWETYMVDIKKFVNSLHMIEFHHSKFARTL